METLSAIRVRNLLLAGCLSLGIVPALAENVNKNPRVIYESRHDLSLPLREMARNAQPDSPRLVTPLDSPRPVHFNGSDSSADSVAQQVYGPQVPATYLLNFDGIAGSQGGGIPPDTNGSAGATQFVQIVNFAYSV